LLFVFLMISYFFYNVKKRSRYTIDATAQGNQAKIP